jgi:hypothetical protein
MNNKQMAAAFKKIGFAKSPIQMTKQGLSYTYKSTQALFTFPESHKEKFQISAPGFEGWSCIMLNERKWKQYQENPYIDWHWDEAKPWTGELSPMEALLCIARGFAQYVDHGKHMINEATP